MRALGLRDRLRTVLFTALAAVMAAGSAWAQPATPVKDINLTREDFNEPLFTFPGFIALGTDVFFPHNDGIHGYELWKTDGSEAGTVLVKDLCPGTCRSWPRHFTPFGGALFFIGDDGVHGTELWRTDGTAAGTTMVLDLRPGALGGPSSLKIAGGVLYLAAEDGVHGLELWKSDGTAAGTVLVKDINPGAEGSDLSLSFLSLDFGGRLLLTADDGVHGAEPWLSDGTADGTALLKDVFPGPEGSLFGIGLQDSAVALEDGSFLFTADDGVHGWEPWKSDGTEANTALLKDINPGPDGSLASIFTPVGSRILFRAYDEAAGTELWSTDGTAAGTALVKDIRPAFDYFPYSSHPYGFRVFGGLLYFQATDDVHGRELWRSDGTEAGTVLVKDLNPGPGDAFSPFFLHPSQAAGGSLLFFADEGVHGFELWKTNGTEAGTVLVKDMEPGAGSGFGLGYSGMAAVGGTVFFHGLTSAHGLEVWKSDGTAAGTAEVKNIATLTSSLDWWNGFGTTADQRINGKLLLEADDGVSGFEPWISDGTAAGTLPLGDLTPGPDRSWPRIYPLGVTTVLTNGQGGIWITDGTPAGTSQVTVPGLTSASHFGPALGALFFSGRDSSWGDELWKTDGTAAGTVRLNDIYSGIGGSYPSGFTDLGAVVIFTAHDGFRRGLWRTAGTAFSTFALTGASVSRVSEITRLGGAALFVCDVAGSGEELCRTDGTLPGTILLKDIRPGAASSRPYGFTVAGSRAFFFADDGAAGRELWVTDGTAAGTVPVDDLYPGLTSSGGRIEGVLGDRLVFSADNGVTGQEPWVSDGTPAGTFLLKDLYPGPRSSEIGEEVVAGDRLYFEADDGVHGRELWVTDGTAAGTRLAHDLVPGPGSPVIRNLAAMDHLALFTADDGVHGSEMWRSNGAPTGTFLVQDIAPGPLHASPGGFTVLGDDLYFAANDNVTGFEPWKVSRAALLTTFQDVPPDHWAWAFVEALAAEGLTTGCAPRQYCPALLVSRAEMAIFLERGLHGGGYVPPPATGTVFTDVPASHWAAAWIEQFAADGITSGCAPSQFCPDALVNRAEMAVFLLRAKHGAAYTPPPATGTVFTDVPASYWAAAWIERLAAEGITTGCAPNQYCPGGSVSRDQMAAFLARTFGLL